MAKYRIPNNTGKAAKRLSSLDPFRVDEEISLTRGLIESAIRDGDRVGAVALLHCLTSLVRANVKGSEFSGQHLALPEIQKLVESILVIFNEELARVENTKLRNEIVDAVSARIGLTLRQAEQPKLN